MILLLKRRMLSSTDNQDFVGRTAMNVKNEAQLGHGIQMVALHSRELPEVSI